MTIGPTLTQWKERALVAEALLEERTQELEGLRAEMEDLKAKQPEKVRDPRGDVWGMTREQFMTEFPAPVFGDEYRKLIEGDKWSQSDIEKITKYMTKAPLRPEDKHRIDPKKPPTHPPSPTRRNESDDFRRFQQHAPRMNIENVQCELKLGNGDFRVGLEYHGKPYEVTLESGYYEYLRGGSGGLVRLSDLVSSQFRQTLGLSQRDFDTLRLRVRDATELMERR